MLKYVDYKVVFREIPNEVTLAINISGCPIKCPDCHSKYLWEDIGSPLTDIELEWILCANDGITCVAFMGGDANPEDIVHYAKLVKEKFEPLKVAWYSGEIIVPNCVDKNLEYFDYLKFGPFIKEKGPLNNPNTNQQLLAKVNDGWIDITNKFWSK